MQASLRAAGLAGCVANPGVDGVEADHHSVTRVVMKRAELLSWTIFGVIALTAGACSHWRDRGSDCTAGNAAYDNQTSLDKAPASTTDR